MWYADVAAFLPRIGRDPGWGDPEEVRLGRELPRPRGTSPNPDLARRAGELIARGEAIDPSLPELEGLRAVRLLAEGDVDGARRHAGHLDHGTYLWIFHGLGCYIPGPAGLTTTRW